MSGGLTLRGPNKMYIKIEKENDSKNPAKRNKKGRDNGIL